jgi:galactokinase
LENENVTGNEALKAEQFEALKPKTAYQIPLFNSLEHQDYQIFLGLPVSVDFETMCTRPIEQGRRLMQENTDKEKYHYRLYQDKSDSSYIAEIVVALSMNEESPARKQDLYFLTGRTNDKTQAVKSLNASQLLERFKRN